MGEMNRFIFRAKGKNTKKWIYGAYLKMLPYTPAPIRNEDDVIPESDYKHLIITEGFSDWNMARGLQAFDIIPETVGQCTGLKDKNGNLIFEGDVLSDAGYKYIVEWSLKNGYFIRKPHICELFTYRIDEETTRNLRIVGNIHDNPEYKIQEVQYGLRND